MSFPQFDSHRGGQHPEFDDEVRFKIYEEAEDIISRTPKSSDVATVAGDPASSSASLPTVEESASGVLPAPSTARRLPSNKSIVVQVWADDAKEPKIVGETVVDLTEVFKTCEQDGQ